VDALAVSWEWTGLDRLRWQDVVDIAVLTFILFRTYVWLRGTVALQVVFGMLAILAAAFMAREAGLVLTAYVLQGAGAASILVAVVVFRDEIRRGLGRISPLRWWRDRRARNGAAAAAAARAGAYGPLAEGLHALARKKIGALVVIPRRDPIAEHLTGGTKIDALVSPAMLETIFQTGSPVHDGAAVLENDRLALAGAFLPLAERELPDQLGTRHRAAVGISERCDAVAICVSEQRGEVSVAVGGAITKQPPSHAVLARRLAQLVTEGGRLDPRERERRKKQRRRLLLKDVAVALLIFAAVVVAWSRMR
jgi:uncharacterized protein (TIGR00159 family)